jgi:hypothetical protein
MKIPSLFSKEFMSFSSEEVSSREATVHVGALNAVSGLLFEFGTPVEGEIGLQQPDSNVISLEAARQERARKAQTLTPGVMDAAAKRHEADSQRADFWREQALRAAEEDQHDLAA